MLASGPVAAIPSKRLDGKLGEHTKFSERVGSALQHRGTVTAVRRCCVGGAADVWTRCC